ncbi:MAG: serine/threonine protein kinase [Planctomycetota bacterium]|nr:MAG: serine/threonine protein kinase [Planctomycetota bacterium]
MLDIWNKTFAKKAYQKKLLTRKDIEWALKIYYQEQGKRGLVAILVESGLLDKEKAKELKKEVDRFFKGSTLADIQPAPINTQELMKLFWLPQLSKFEILEPIAEGGMGQVFRALNKKNRRSVAIKFLKDKNPQSQKRFLREIRIVKGLSHPNILPILDAGMENDWIYFTMPIVYGQDLDDWVYTKGPLKPEKALMVIKVIGQAVAYAHSKGVIHRDLKPSNILIDQTGTPLLTDFGLAKQMETQTLAITRAGTLIGTPEYMAPEQALGAVEKITYAADIYGLGAILYFCLTGKPPFEGEKLIHILEKVVHQPPIPLTVYQPDIPPEISQLCNQAMAKSPHKRFESCMKFVQEIDNILNKLYPEKAKSHTSFHPAIHSSRKSSKLFFLILVTVLIGLFLVAFYFFSKILHLFDKVFPSFWLY